MWWFSQTLAIRRLMFVSLSVVMIQTGITDGQQQQQPNNVGFVHPMATDTFPVNHPTSAEQQPTAEEDLTSTASPVEPVATAQTASPVNLKQPQFQVPVTLPFVMQRPQQSSPVVGKPSSYLRPIIMIDPITQDEPQPIRQTKPWYGNLPQVEDLSPSPPGVAVTLPIRAKPTSYLRPVFVVDEINEEQKPTADVVQSKPSYYVSTRNFAVTLPFDLRPSLNSEKPKPKPMSYLRPVIVTDADETVPTPEGDYYYYAPAEEDLTSPISGTVQPSPPPQKQSQPLKATKPASYLRPWFVDDSYVTPVRASTRPHQEVKLAASPAIATAQIVDDDSNSVGYYQRPAVSWLPFYRAGSPAVMRDPNSVRPLLYRRPISADDIRENDPWFVPVFGHQTGPVPLLVADYENVAVSYQLLVKPSPIKRPWMLPTSNIVQSSIAEAGQAEARVPFLGNWVNNNNLEKTHVVGNSTLVYTKQNVVQTGTSTVYTSALFTATTTVQNAYCFVSANQVGPPAPWCTFRRKRSALSANLKIDGQTIQPSQIQKILTTIRPYEITSSMAEDVPEGESNKIRRLLNLAANFFTGRPTTTVTLTTLTVVTEITITGTTPITFAGGQCVPCCLQSLPLCGL